MKNKQFELEEKKEEIWLSPMPECLYMYQPRYVKRNVKKKQSYIIKPQTKVQLLSDRGPT